ncbi:hypothetical protein EG68_09574 [Paragonimus skrjabini miyazakii]|uniref:Uncharacterized protein n=1 Tax=Paragonimus skrjabini miyazakii TaxID=59628 RepID=A0A8S9YDK9_9TREM|nr:hypothetical protein EG68_09574 [Paragonimus skrjabini miyazakii]
MPIFLSKKINNIVNEVAIIEWHPKDPLLAIATHSSSDSGDINVLEYQSNFIKSVDGLLVSRPNIVTSLSWHPVTDILAVGWSSGCISVFYVSHRNVVDLAHTMESKIASVTWSSKGTKLLTTDTLGTIYIWKQNAVGEIQQKPYITLTIDSTITCAILIHIVVKDQQHMDISSLAKAAVKGDEKALELLSFKKTSDLCPASAKLCESSTFLVGLDDGRILRVSSEATSTSNIAETGLNRLTTLASCEGGILSLLRHSDAGFLIVITDKAMLYHYQLTPPNGATLKEITKMKLAVGLTGPPSLTWAGDCVLAMATGEPVVRLWDVEHADNYTLVPNLSDCDGHNRTIKVLQVAYSSKHQILAAGLNNGMVAFWQHGEELRTHCDLAKMLQSDPTWGGYQSHVDEFGSFEGEDGLASSRPINLEYTSHRTHRSHGQDKGPEANWHPQPTAILCSKPEEEFTTGLSGLSRQVQLLAWDGSEDRLAIAVSARQLHNQTNFNHGLAPRCAAYLLEQQPLCGHFGGQGCVAVQTGPRSLAMFTVTLANKSSAGDTMKLTTESNDPDGRINPLTVPQPSGLPAAFIATSTAFMSGGVNVSNQKVNLLPDEQSSIPLIREHEAQVEDQIRALYCTQEYVSYWNGYRISTFKHATGDCIVHYASFPCDFRLVGMYEQTLFTVEPFKLQVRTLQGTVRQLINFTEAEGSVVQTAQCTNWMACLTEYDKLRIFDLARREIKCIHSSKSLTELILSTALTSSLRSPYSDTHTVSEEKLKTAGASHKELHIASVAVNQSGNAISFTVDILSDGCVAQVRWPSDYCSKNSDDRDLSKFHQNVATEVQQQEQKQQLLRDEINNNQSLKKWIPDTRIYIYYLEKDKLQYFDFCATWPDASWLNVTSNNNVTIGRWPKHHFWDQYEPRLLAIEAAPLPLTHPIYGKQYADCNDRPPTINHLMLPTQMDRQHEEAARSKPSTSPEQNAEEHSRASSKMTDMPGCIQLSNPKVGYKWFVG